MIQINNKNGVLYGDIIFWYRMYWTRSLTIFDTTYPRRIPQLRGRIYLGGKYMKGGRKSKLAFFCCLQLRGSKLLFSCVIRRRRFIFQLRRRIDLSSKGRQLLITKGYLIKVMGGEVITTHVHLTTVLYPYSGGTWYDSQEVVVLVHHYLCQEEKHKQRLVSLLLRNHGDTFILQ